MAVTLPYILFDFVYFSIDFISGYFRLICDICALSSNRPTASIFKLAMHNLLSQLVQVIMPGLNPTWDH
jgi:hypothetical protein